MTLDTSDCRIEELLPELPPAAGTPQGQPSPSEPQRFDVDTDVDLVHKDLDPAAELV